MWSHVLFKDNHTGWSRVYCCVLYSHWHWLLKLSVKRVECETWASGQNTQTLENWGVDSQQTCLEWGRLNHWVQTWWGGLSARGGCRGSCCSRRRRGRRGRQGCSRAATGRGRRRVRPTGRGIVRVGRVADQVRVARSGRATIGRRRSRHCRGRRRCVRRCCRRCSSIGSRGIGRVGINCRTDCHRPPQLPEKSPVSYPQRATYSSGSARRACPGWSFRGACPAETFHLVPLVLEPNFTCCEVKLSIWASWSRSGADR